MSKEKYEYLMMLLFLGQLQLNDPKNGIQGMNMKLEDKLTLHRNIINISLVNKVGL
jgi:hypothetical protein